MPKAMADRRMIRVCLGCSRGAEQLVKVQPGCTPVQLAKAALAKFKIKGKQRGLVLCREDGNVLDSEAAVAALKTMSIVYLVRTGEQAASLKSGGDDPLVLPKGQSLPDDLAELVLSFVPMQQTDYSLLSLATVSRAWARFIPLRFLPELREEKLVLSEGRAVHYVGLGRWLWRLREKKGASWTRYGEDARLCLEDAFARGAESAVVELREAQSGDGRVKRPRKKLAVVDFRAMKQRSMSGKGRAFDVLRVPRPFGAN